MANEQLFAETFDASHPLTSEFFSRLYALCFPRAVRYLVRNYHLTVETAEDYVQDAFLLSWKYRATFVGSARLLLHDVYRYMRQFALRQRLRRRNPSRSFFSLQELTESAEAGMEEHSPMLQAPLSTERMVVMREELREVGLALQRCLPTEQQAMREQMMGYTIAEIAVRMQNRTVEAVNIYLVRARKKIRRGIAERIWEQPVYDWHPKYPACIICHSTKYKHRGRGYCLFCHNKLTKFKNPNPRPHTPSWSEACPVCVVCGSADSPHLGRGMCSRCYMRQYRAKKTEAAGI